MLPGHWGGDWHLDTHPHVYTIILHPTFTRAIIDFRVGYQGGKAFLEKGKHGWKVLKSELTWIE